MKKILITGGNGQVAYDLIQLSKMRGYEYLAPTREELDITQEESIEAITRFKPDAVINTAAYTKVDLAEKEVAQAFAVNAHGAKNIALACEQIQCPLVHISTDYIFDGQATTPYHETDHAAPLNVYGNSKYQGELAVQQVMPSAMILRVSGVFGVHGHNFVKTMLRFAGERDILKIVADQTICPTPSKAIAETILQMLIHPVPGIYHYCSQEKTTWHAFTKAIVEQIKKIKPIKVKEILPITTAEYPLPAKRPAYSVLNCQKIADIFHIAQPSWEKGLIDVITHLSTA